MSQKVIFLEIGAIPTPAESEENADENATCYKAHAMVNIWNCKEIP